MEFREAGEEAVASGRVAVITLAAGVGSRWTAGAGVVKALHPFCRLAGRHRSFLEVHLAKSRRINRLFGSPLPHVITTSYLTHRPIEEYLGKEQKYGYDGPLVLSPAFRSVFAWSRWCAISGSSGKRHLSSCWTSRRRRSVRVSTARSCNGLLQPGKPRITRIIHHLQCLHPVGHWYEIPNMLKNGVLLNLLDSRPNLKYLMVHNIDTLGADVDPVLLGLHILEGNCLTFEVVRRRIEDRGGGLAQVAGRVRLVEGLALPREEDEFKLSFYNSNTSWIDIDQLLQVFGLTKPDLADPGRVAAAVRAFSVRMPSYVTLKNVKKRWGHGQEDIFPVTQFEKLWGDMTSLPEVKSGFVLVSRMRGQQLKDQAQLDAWVRDGSVAYVEGIADF